MEVTVGEKCKMHHLTETQDMMTVATMWSMTESKETHCTTSRKDTTPDTLGLNYSINMISFT